MLKNLVEDLGVDSVKEDCSLLDGNVLTIKAGSHISNDQIAQFILENMSFHGLCLLSRDCNNYGYGHTSYGNKVKIPFNREYTEEED